MNDSIRNIALLGTDRSQVSPDLLPPYLKDTLNESASSEELVLDAISYMSCINQFGFQLPACEETAVENIIDENRPYTSDEISALLNDLLAMHSQLRESLLKSWLEMLQARGELLLPKHVLSLIQTGNSSTEEIREMILSVIGNRGRKIIPLLPNEKYTDSVSIERFWNEGNAEQRRRYFLNARQKDPQKALELLNESWNAENVRDKAAFLRIIAETLTPQDLPFLENLYTNFYAAKYFQKTVERECKWWVCHMLLRLDYQPLVNAITSGLAPYVRPENSRTFLGKTITISRGEINLPQTGDLFWNGKYLNELVGLEEKNTDLLHFDNDPLFWLNELIEILPFHLWTEIFQSDHERIVRYFISDNKFHTIIKGDRIPVFKNTLFKNTVLTKDQDLIQALTEILVSDELITLIPLMSQPLFEKYMETQPSSSVFELLNKREDQPRNKWSLAFTRKIMQQYIRDLNAGKAIVQVNHGIIIAKFADNKILEIINELTHDQANATWMIQWRNLIVDPIEKYNYISNKITHYIN